jgi:hypothetical protein
MRVVMLVAAIAWMIAAAMVLVLGWATVSIVLVVGMA